MSRPGHQDIKAAHTTTKAARKNITISHTIKIIIKEDQKNQYQEHQAKGENVDQLRIL